MPFSELYGQQRAVRQLLGLVTAGRLPQALLLSGPKGVGKSLAARCLVQAVSCREPAADGDGCGRCRSCIQVERGRFPDLLTVVPDGSFIRVEQVETVQEFVTLSPVVGPRRWVVIEAAHRLHEAAANRLLKTLEEPPPRVVFVLVSHRHHRLPETVVSRCLQVVFNYLSTEAVARVLEGMPPIAGEGEPRVASERAAAWSGGSLARADFFRVTENLEWGRGLLAAFSRLPESNVSAALELAGDAARCGEREMLFYLLAQALRGALRLASGGDVEPAEWHSECVRLARFGPATLLLWQRRLQEIEEGLAFNLNLELALDAFFLELVTARAGG